MDGTPARSARPESAGAEGCAHGVSPAALPWVEARALAHRGGASLGVEEVPLVEADGRVLGAGLTTVTDLPPFPTSALDGWAVAGPGPWRVGGRVLAGAGPTSPLAPGRAVAIATGARVPDGATAVLATEDGELDGVPPAVADGTGARGDDPTGDGGLLRGRVEQGWAVRPAGEEASRGEVLLPAGTRLDPVRLGLAAAAGHDRLPVAVRPGAVVLVLGDELLRAGPARDGRIRDSLGPAVPGLLERLGARPVGVRRVPDTLAAHVEALAAARGTELVVTTGGTASGPVDHLHAAVAAVGGELLVDGVAVRPGRPMLLARLAERCWLLGLPGNPQAAVAALLTLGAPLVHALLGRGLPDLPTAVLGADVAAPVGVTRLVAARWAAEVEAGAGTVVPVPGRGPGMLRGLAVADGFAVVPPGGAGARQTVGWLPLPR